MEQLELELSEREASLQQQVTAAHKGSSKRVTRLEQQLAETQVHRQVTSTQHWLHHVCLL